MNMTVKAGILIGGLCSAWMLVMGLFRFYTHPVLLNLFWMVIVIQIAVLVWGLRKTAPERSYGGQVATGMLMSAIAAGILFCWSFFFTTVLFPHYFEELRAAHEAMLRAAGTPEAEAQKQIAAAAAEQTPLIQAVSGAVGTLFTGLVASLIIGVFARKKPTASASGAAA